MADGGASAGAASDGPEPAPAPEPEPEPEPEPSIEPFGDAALLISAGTARTPALASWAGAVAGAIEARRATVPAIGRPVPAHASILVPFDPLALDLDDAIGLARSAVSAVAGAPPGSISLAAQAAAPNALVDIPVRYGGGDGPDLDAVADAVGLRPADVVELHAAARYRVLFLGFAPGFAYLGGLPPALATPRRASPRERVPAGSVGISGEQTAVYPLAMPGGWQLIGRTDEILFDPAADPPARLRPGMEVRFVPRAPR